jgi:mannose-6-phosphate isomerase-like protein (cupin superfamily)
MQGDAFVARRADSPVTRGFLDSADYWTLFDRHPEGHALYSIEVYEPMEPEVHEHFDQLFIVEGGAGSVVLDGVEMKVQSGDAVWIPRGAWHAPQPGDEPLRYWCVSFAQGASERAPPP